MQSSGKPVDPSQSQAAPLAASAPPDPGEADRRYLRTLTVLCVDDDEEACALMAEFVGRRAGRAVTANDGEEGLRIFRERRPDVVVTDIRMPHKDGLTLVREIRALAPRVPVVVTTAFEHPGYFVRSIDLGVDKYIVKPVDLGRLEAALLECAHRLRAEEEVQRRGELEAALRRHQAVGLLAGGMAHDYNNLLQAILGNVCLARGLAEPEGELDELLAAAEASAKRAGELGQLLVTVASGGRFRAEPVSIAEILDEAIAPVLEHTRVTYKRALGGGLPEGTAVRADRHQLGVLFAQLADNAVAAMGSSGALQVTALPLHHRQGADPLGDRPELPLPEGDYLDVAVSDTGPGVPAALARTVFEPYVSTKERGAHRGTGLGLTMCRSIVQRHGGLITLDTPAPATGATFHVYLPRT